MKQFVFTFLVLVGHFAQARDFSLSDSEVLGQYSLTSPEIGRFSSALMSLQNGRPILELGDREGYVLSAPNADRVIYAEDGEPNCDDRDECYYDARIEVRLVSVGAGPNAKPRLKVSITRVNAYDENAEWDTTDYLFDKR